MTWGEALTLLGVVLAILQMLRTESVARATHGAVTATARQIGDYNLLLLIPEMTRIESDLLRVAASGNADPNELRRLLLDWRDVVADVRGFLDHGRVGEGAQDLRVNLQASLAAASRAKESVLGGAPALKATEQVRDAMSRVCEGSRALSAQLRVDVEVPEPPPTLYEQLVGLIGRAGKDTSSG